jgi:hypothetical protein
MINLRHSGMSALHQFQRMRHRVIRSRTFQQLATSLSSLFLQRLRAFLAGSPLTPT